MKCANGSLRNIDNGQRLTPMWSQKCDGEKKLHLITDDEIKYLWDLFYLNLFYTKKKLNI